MWRFYWEIKPILMSWLLMRAALTGWPQPFNGKPTDTPFLSLKWLLISSSPALYPLRPNQFATLEHFKTDITAFTHLQTCWSLLWDQFRGSGDLEAPKQIVKVSFDLQRSQIILIPISWGEFYNRIQESLGKRSHDSRCGEIRVIAVGCMGLLIYWRPGKIL